MRHTIGAVLFEPRVRADSSTPPPAFPYNGKEGVSIRFVLRLRVKVGYGSVLTGIKTNGLAHGFVKGLAVVNARVGVEVDGDGNVALVQIVDKRERLWKQRRIPGVAAPAKDGGHGRGMVRHLDSFILCSNDPKPLACCMLTLICQ